MRILVSVLPVSLALAVSLSAQEDGARYNPDHRFSPEELQEDYALLRSALEEAHSGLYRYSDRAAIDRMFDDAAEQLGQPLTELEFVRALAPVIAGVNDGHTGLMPSPGLDAYLRDQPLLLPVKLWFSERRAFVERNYGDDPRLVPGGEVTHVNGMAMSEVLEHLLPTVVSDGRVETSKYRRGLDGTNVLGRAYSVVFGVTTRYALRYVPLDGSVTETITVDGLTAAELTHRYRERFPELQGANPPPIELAYHDDIPVLTVRTFGGGAYRGAGIDYADFLKDAFGDIAGRGVEHLIIDVRGNGGGSDEYGKLLAAYLMDQEFEYYRSLEINAPTFSFLQHTNRPGWEAPADGVRQNDRGTYDALGHPNLGPQQPLAPGFRGQTIVLIDGGSFSATGEFTSVVHHHKKATFVGEESGAGYYGNTSGSSLTLTLTETGIRVRIPLIRYTCAVSGYEPRDRGLIPDHAVSPTIADILAERDIVLEYAIGLAKDGEGVGR